MSQDPVAALYRRYRQKVYKRCLRILGDSAAAEDATQETFVRVFRHAAKSPADDEALKWMYCIARNYCLNELRNRNLRPEPQADLPEAPPEPTAFDLSDREFVHALLGRSPRPLAAAAWLYHVDGRDQAEVGRLLGISRRTVIHRLQAFHERADRFARSA